MATAVSVLTGRDFPLELVLGKIGNCNLGMEPASLTRKLARNNDGINPESLRGSTPTAAALRRAVRCMKEAEKPLGPPSPNWKETKEQRRSGCWYT